MRSRSLCQDSYSMFSGHRLLLGWVMLMIVNSPGVRITLRTVKDGLFQGLTFHMPRYPLRCPLNNRKNHPGGHQWCCLLLSPGCQL